ncbi:MAG: PAS domain-containing sensor histidine kinase [Nitrospirales bacterium]
MTRTNAKPTAQRFLSLSRDSRWPALGKMTDSSIRDRSWKLALEMRPLPEPPVVSQFVHVVNGMPVPALLLTESGRILTVNSSARSLLSHVDACVLAHQEQHLWTTLGWPSVPFCHWDWNGTLVSAWDCVLGRSSDMPNLKIRYLTTEVKMDSDRDISQQRLAVLGQEVMQVAHDIRNPLTSLEWFATLLGKEGQSLHERQDLVNHLVHVIRMLDASLANVLIFAKPIHMDKQRFRISRLLGEVEWLAMQPLRKKEITIHRSVESGLDELWGDESLVSRAVLNVVLNAIQVSPSGGRIEIICQRVVRQQAGQMSGKERRDVQIIIRDFGCGIPREEVNAIFDPFFSKRKGGTGLGLSIVKHIINAHHGLIDVQSEHGKGTTICLVLPQ